MNYKSSAAGAFLILFLCLASYFVPFTRQKTENNSENRTMATFNMVFNPEAGSVVYHASPVERLDAALSDQFVFREFVIRNYLRFFNFAENAAFNLTKLFTGHQNDRYILKPLGKYQLIGDTGYITTFPAIKPMNKALLQQKMEQLDYIHEKFPQLKIYFYYVTNAFDTSWFNNYLGITAADHYQELLDVKPEYVKAAHLIYKDLDDYMNLHYKTDHHWNHRGARRGYEDIYAMMSEDFDMGDIRVPLSGNNVSKTYDFVFLGSYGKALGDLYKYSYDDFSFYEYDFPKWKTTVINPESREEIEVVKIGLYDEYRDGKINKKIGIDHYAMFGKARDEAGKTYDDQQYPFVIKNSKGGG